ncbi:MAG: sigma-70 family RNA polymerase sigma factor [Ruminococcaceae bacterium]|nr:sigma-70 family RNA polymerase sigma factor [Oscillospiraceae bacterium]
MFFNLVAEVMRGIIYLALHVTNAGAFPKALSLKEETELIEQMANGSEKAKNKLIEHNLRLVAHIVKKYYSGQVEQDDLISIGTIGLIKAVSTFKPTKGIRLATYAARCIENEILMCFRNIKKSANDVFISDPIDTDGEGNALTLIDIISDNEDIVESIDLKIKTENLRRFVMTALDDRERKIIILRYGLYGNHELTQHQVAKRLGISRSYVSRIEKKALEKLYSCFARQ